MEKTDYGPSGDRVNVCSSCFGKLVSFMLTNPSLLKQMGLAPALRAIPLEQGVVEPCEECNFEKATGYIPCSKPKSVERERVRE